jgi:hypothetical protein
MMVNPTGIHNYRQVRVVPVSSFVTIRILNEEKGLESNRNGLIAAIRCALPERCSLCVLLC